MSVEAAIWINWDGAATGLLTNAKVSSCCTFADLPDTDPTLVYQGPGTSYEAMALVDDAGNVPALPFAVNVNGAPMTTGGGKWMAFDYSNPVLEWIRVYFHGGASPAITLKQDVLKFGHVIFNVANATASLNNLDHSIMYSPFAGMQHQIASGLNRIVAHTSGGGTSGDVLTVTPGKMYFYELLKRSSTGMCYIRFRDPDDNYSIIGTISLGFTPDAYGTYADLWGCASNHPDCTGRVLWGNAGYIYEPANFLDFSTPLNIGTVNFGSLNIG